MRRGFTIIEALMATLFVAILLVTGLQTASTSATVQYKGAERATARYLAQGLMTEILAKNYEESNFTTLTLGPEATAGELLTSKTNWDDVDDYNGWSESPPQDPSGTALSGYSGWSRSVVVEWVTWANTNTTSLTETGVKRITVSVYHNSTFVMKLVALKAKSS